MSAYIGIYIGIKQPCLKLINTNVLLIQIGYALGQNIKYNHRIRILQKKDMRILFLGF